MQVFLSTLNLLDINIELLLGIPLQFHAFKNFSSSKNIQYNLPNKNHHRRKHF